MNTVRIPQFLSCPMAVLWFETDELIVLMFASYIAILTGGIIPALLSIGLFIYYRKVKKRSGRGLLRHLPHILGFKTFQGFPHSFVKKFRE